MALPKRQRGEEMAGEKILVVDDHKVVCLGFQAELKQEGYDVDIATSGAEAVEKAKVEKYDLIFIDFVMPEMSGTQTAKALRGVSPASKLVMMTGQIRKGHEREETEFFQTAKNVFRLNKPFPPGALAKLAGQALSEK